MQNLMGIEHWIMSVMFTKAALLNLMNPKIQTGLNYI